MQTNGKACVPGFTVGGVSFASALLLKHCISPSSIHLACVLVKKSQINRELWAVWHAQHKPIKCFKFHVLQLCFDDIMHASCLNIGMNSVNEDIIV
jgi:hypothetical protein